MTDQDTDNLDAQTYSALPPHRKVEIAGELLKRQDWKAIKNLGIKIMTLDEWMAEHEGPDVIEIKSLN